MLFNLLSLFSLLILAHTQSRGCRRAFNQIELDITRRDTTKLLKDISPFGELSGKGPNRWGDYDACIRDPTKRYVVLSISDPQFGTQNIGICISSQCSDKDLQIETPLIKLLIQRSIAYIDITNSEVEFINPLTLYQEKNISFYLTITYLLILLSITLLHPFTLMIQAMNSKNDNKINIKTILNVNDESLQQPGSVSVDNDSTSTLLRSTQKKQDQGGRQTYYPLKIQVDDKKEQSFLQQISIIESYNQLFTFNTPDPNLSIFNGFRSIALVMVVFGHQYFITLPLTDQQEVAIQLKRWMGLLLFDCQYAVDIFFWIGGFFLGFIMVEVKKKTLIQKQGYKGILLVVLHRVLRIWPCYLTTILILSNLTPFLGEGPRWFQVNGIDDCSTWWRNALFMDNLFDDGQFCMGWAWYLSNDFQLFLVSLIPIYIYAKYQPKLAKYSIIALIVITQLCGILISNRDNLLYFYLQGSAANLFQKNYYTKPWCRGPPYFLGLLFGIMYREYKTQNKLILNKEVSNVSPSGRQKDQEYFTAIQSLQNWYHQNIRRQVLVISSLYIIGFGLIGLISFGWRSYQVNGQDYWPRGISILWQGFCRLFYCFGLTLITLICCLGQKDYFNEQIMNCLLFRFLSKISFTCYMIHYIVIKVTMSNFYEHPELTFISQIQFFTGNFLITIFFASLMTLIVEMPFAKLEQLLSSKLSPQQQLHNMMEQKLIT